MNYQETISYLYNRLPVFHNIGAKAYKPGLKNTLKLMDTLNHPYRNYKTIHVAGTNGKGSVAHFLSAILQSAGYRVGLYTSPHLVDFGERIRVNGEKIERDYIVDFVENNKESIESIQPSFFETTMAMAFQYFSDKNVDITIVEVGLGGRLDSTNIINPILSIITNIGLDHTQFLGNTLAEIAGEKAGIIKPNTPVIIGETQDETKDVFVNKAMQLNAPIIFADSKLEKLNFQPTADKLYLLSTDGKKNEIGLRGKYQQNNVKTVLVAVQKLRELGLKISDCDTEMGLRDVVLLTGIQGRWQVVSYNPMVILDTGHNVEGMRYVTNQLNNLDFKKLHFVFGMVDDKDINHVLELLPKEALYYFTAANTQRALSPTLQREMAARYGLSGDEYSSVKEAVEQAIKNTTDKDVVFIGGSNYVVGEAIIALEELFVE